MGVIGSMLLPSITEIARFRLQMYYGVSRTIKDLNPKLGIVHIFPLLYHKKSLNVEVIKMFRTTIPAIIIGLLIISISIGKGTFRSVEKTKESEQVSSNVNAKQDSIKIGIASPQVTEFKSSGGDVPSFTSDSSNVNRAFAFLDEIKSRYGINNPRTEFKIRRIINHNNIRSVVLDQVFNGIKVRNGYFTINLARNDSLTLNDIMGNYYPNAHTVSTNPTISIDLAKQIVTSHPKAKGSGPEYITNSELIIGKFDDSMHLAWAITMFRADSVVVGDEFFIDAHDGNVLEVQNKIMY
jgi:hypothetical protein